MNTGKLLAGILAGVAAGAILGVLFAPDKGSATRKKLSAKGEDLTDAVKEKLNDLLEKFNKDVEAVKAKTNEFKENVIVKAEKFN